MFVNVNSEDELLQNTVHPTLQSSIAIKLKNIIDIDVTSYMKQKAAKTNFQAKNPNRSCQREHNQRWNRSCKVPHPQTLCIIVGISYWKKFFTHWNTTWKQWHYAALCTENSLYINTVTRYDQMWPYRTIWNSSLHILCFEILVNWYKLQTWQRCISKILGAPPPQCTWSTWPYWLVHYLLRISNYSLLIMQDALGKCLWVCILNVFL